MVFTKLLEASLLKATIVLFAFLLGTGTLSAQDQHGFEPESQAGPSHAFGDILVAASGSHITANAPFESVFAGGLHLKVYVGQRFSFDTDLAFGPDYTHMGPGLIGLPLWILASSVGFNDEGSEIDLDDPGSSLLEYVIKGVVMVLSAERFSYHHPINPSLELSPYISLLRIKMIDGLPVTESSDGFENYACAALGMELNKYYKNWVFSPYMDYNISYNGDIRGFNIGVYAGYYFGKKWRE